MRFTMFSPRKLAYALENMQFLHDQKWKHIFSVSLIGGFDSFTLFISTHNNLSMSGFTRIWII